MSLGKALQLRRTCDYRGALAALADADDAASLVERSRLREELGDYDGAWADAERAASLDGGPTAQARLAAVARSRRAPLLALELLATVPGPEAQAERAGALGDLARFGEAEQLLDGLECDEPRVRHAAGICRGGIARSRGDYDTAERTLRDAIAHAEAVFGADALETAEGLNALGMVFKYAGRFDEATALYRRAVDIVERAAGETTPDTAALYHNLGGVEHARSNFEDAERYARRSVEIRRATLPADHPSIAEDEAALAPILHALGRDDEAEALLRRALPVLEDALGPVHPEVGVAWNNLATVLQSGGDLDGAAEAFHHALGVKEHVFGADHPSLALTLNNLAVNARRRGRADEAEGLYLRALAALRAVEPDHPTRVLTVRNYARLLRGLGRESDAAQLDAGRTEPGPPSRRAHDSHSEAEVLAGNTNEAGSTDGDAKDDEEVETHMLASNDNETGIEDRRRLAANTNEEALADDGVEGD